MPYTIKTQEVKYKDSSTGNYVGFNAVAERTTAEYQSAITNAGTAAVSAINTKAQEVTSQLASSGEMEGMLAGAFSSSTNYNKGQYVIVTINNVNKLYKFTAYHAAGAWTGLDAVEVKLGNDVETLNSAMNSPDLTAGNAFEVISDRGDTDITPYVFRKTGGAKKAYNREMLKKIVGGTVAWNQMVINGNFTEKATWTVYQASYEVASNEATITIGSGNTDGSCFQDINTPAQGHKYLCCCFAKVGTADIARIFISKTSSVQKGTTSSSYELLALICESDTTKIRLQLKLEGSAGQTAAFKNVQCFDLTQMFGSTIADAIYAMEQATAGSGVAFFRSLFPNDYYAYDAGTLMSVQAKEHRTVGFNQWDEEWENGYIDDQGVKVTFSSCVCSKNFCTCIPGATYYTTCGKMDGGSDNKYYLFICFYDKDYNFILRRFKNNLTVEVPANARYFKISTNPNSVVYGGTYNHDIVVNLHLDGERDGKYEPYDGHVYPLDSSLTLRGIPKWDSTNWLYYDGDEYTPDGSVKRRYGIVDLGTLTWTAVTDSHGDFFKAVLPAKARNVNSICPKYTTGINPYTNDGDKILLTYIEGEYGKVVIRDTAYSDAATFKSAMSGVYLVYNLSTPTTETADPYHEIQICNRYGTEEFVDAAATAETPTRDVSIPVGTDTLYNVNVFDYIEELTNPDHDMIADSNIQSGKYFMVGNTLYLSTAAIAQGAAIVPGTNCTTVSLAEALNTINT